MIPSRLPEPATPQNTPADVAFSGFHAYRQQQQQQEAAAGINSSFGFNESLKGSIGGGQLEAIKEGAVAASSDDKTFTPISAAQVSEKLENLIAAEQNEDTQSVKSELSAEVANITAGIPKSEPVVSTEELTEIDLNSSGNLDNLVPLETKFDITSETVPETQPQSLDSFTVPSATTFFVNPPASNHSVPSFYNPSFQSHPQAVSDPFSFVQSTPPRNYADSATNFAGPQLLNVGANRPPQHVASELSNAGPESSDNVDLMPQSIWGSNTQTQV